MTTQVLPPKKEVALALLERSNVDVYLDPRAAGVVVPPQFRKEPRLILKIGLNMPVPIPDLRLDEESMSCTLSFNRARFYCIVPWSSVFAMVGDDGRGMVWPEDVPQELAVRTTDEPQRPSAGGREELVSVPTGPSAGSGSSTGATGVSGPSSSRSSSQKGKSRIQPDAPRTPRDSASETNADRAARAKRPRKKKEEGAAARPMLVAVPPPAKSSPRVEKLDDRREASAAAAAAAAAATERNGERNGERAGGGDRPSSPTAGGTDDRDRRDRRDRVEAGPRPKRELPPYLRVVK